MSTKDGAMSDRERLAATWKRWRASRGDILSITEDDLDSAIAALLRAPEAPPREAEEDAALDRLEREEGAHTVNRSKPAPPPEPSPADEALVAWCEAEAESCAQSPTTMEWAPRFRAVAQRLRAFRPLTGADIEAADMTVSLHEYEATANFLNRRAGLTP